MQMLYRFALAVALVAVCAVGQGSRGGGGGGGSGGGSSGGSRISRGGSCTGVECRRNGIIVGSIIGGIFGLIAVVFTTIFCYRRCKGKPKQPNQVFVEQSVPKDQIYEEDHFTSGGWSSQYHQYGKWHGPHQWTLQFDRATNRVTGEGNDDIGRFTVDGTFSVATHRFGMTKTYQLGTGNPKENSGHQVTIQLKWNNSTNRFEGKWYVQTKKYRGEGNFQLTPNNHQTNNFEKGNFEH